MTFKYLTLFLAIIFFSTGCAVRPYTQLLPITTLQANRFSCDDIRTELSKVDVFESEIENKGGGLTTFNVGTNHTGPTGFDRRNEGSSEKDEAIQSAVVRRNQLNELYADKLCRPQSQ